MKLSEYRKKKQQDPEHIATKKELKPLLDLADKVLDLRLEREWSQAELARRADVGGWILNRIETGIGNPSLGTLLRIAGAFGLQLKIDFVEERDEHN